jgi:nucleoside phosphorylase
MSVFLFITANEHEREAFEKWFVRRDEDSIKSKPYYLGEFGCYSAAYIHMNEQGYTNPAAMPLVGELIRKLHPVAVVMVGIAFGANECNQKIGDVLVSSKILPYDSAKLLNGQTLYKESSKEAGFQLLNAFSEHREWNYSLPNSQRSFVHIGPILTGSKLINDYEYRTRLLNDFIDDEPIGGEMEAQGIYSVSRIQGVSEWIIIKGICDWGYNKNNPNKEIDQKVAANAAVNFCLHIFSKPRVFDELINFPDRDIDMSKFNSETMKYISNSNEKQCSGNINSVIINAGSNTVISLNSPNVSSKTNSLSDGTIDSYPTSQKDGQEITETQKNINKLSESEQYIVNLEYVKAIETINDVICSIKKQHNDDNNELLVDCYRLKCTAYKALGGNGNLLFAVLCNKAQHALL